MAAERDIRVKFTGDTKDLDKAAGDAEKSIGGASKGIGGSLEGLSGKAAEAGAAVAAGVGVAMVAWDLAQAAMEDEAGASALAQNLRTAAHATEPAIEAAEDYISALSGTVAIADDELRPALSRLATSTGDTAEAQDLLAVAADIAAGSGKDLGTVAEALAKGHEGQMKGLIGLGIETENAEGKQKSFAEVLDDAKGKFAGAGKAAADTTAGGMKKFGIGLDELKESVGAKFLPAVKVAFEFLNSNAVPAAATAFDAVSGALARVATFLGDVFAAIGEKVAPIIAEVRGGIEAFVAAFVDGSDDITSSGFAGFLEQLGVIARNVFDALAAAWARVAALWDQHGEAIMATLGTVATFIGTTVKDAFTTLVSAVATVADTIGAFWSEWGDEIIGVLTTVATAVVGFVQRVIEFGAALGERLAAFWNEWGDEILGFVKLVIELFKALFERVNSIVRPALEAFLTVFTITFNLIRTVVTVVFNALVGVIRGALQIIGAVIGVALDVIRWVWDRWGEGIMAFVGNVFGIIGSIIRFAMDVIVNTIRFFTAIFKGDWSAAFGAVVDTVKLAVFFIGDFMGRIGGIVVDAVKGVGSLISAPFIAAFNLIADAWNSTVGKLSFTFPEWIPSLGGRTIDVPDLPRFQTFGALTIVMPPGTDGYDVARQLATFSRTVAPLEGMAVAVR